MKLEFINGDVIEYNQDFINDDKYKFKIRADISGDSVSESIWALMNPEDYEDYKSDVVDHKYKRAAILLNKSIYGPQWGSAILYKLNGSCEMPTSTYTDYSEIPDDLPKCKYVY